MFLRWCGGVHGRWCVVVYMGVYWSTWEGTHLVVHMGVCGSVHEWVCGMVYMCVYWCTWETMVYIVCSGVRGRLWCTWEGNVIKGK